MRITIIGGGIGGLSVAIALRKIGFQPEVFEQAPELRDVGAAIAVWSNAMRLLEYLGVGPQVLAHAGIIERIRWIYRDGRTLNQTPLKSGDAPSVALRRSDLQSALREALPAESVHLGKVFVDFAVDDDGISIKFADGSSVTSDLLIGADGSHSRLRTLLIGDQLPAYRGYATWRGVAGTTPRDVPYGEAIEIHGYGRRFGIGPVGHGQIGWWASNNGRGPGTGHDAKQNREELLNLFDGWSGPAQELIRATAPETIVRNDIFDRTPSESWGRGRVTMLGDAVHPTTPDLGQGGCLAIEDSVVLARCLEKYARPDSLASITDIELALRTFEQRRKLRTATIVAASRRYGATGQWANRIAVRLRRGALPLLPRPLLRFSFATILDYDARSVRI
jgi:2-polyprenyl-6-methoxyphenol hydroxylase-like FAD-dependent oxidoreductase